MVNPEIFCSPNRQHSPFTLHSALCNVKFDCYWIWICMFVCWNVSFTTAVYILVIFQILAWV